MPAGNAGVIVTLVTPDDNKKLTGSTGVFWQATWLVFPDKYDIDCNGFTVMVPVSVFPQVVVEEML